MQEFLWLWLGMMGYIISSMLAVALVIVTIVSVFSLIERKLGEAWAAVFLILLLIAAATAPVAWLKTNHPPLKRMPVEQMQ